jgi:peroxiredoxin
MMSCAPIPEGTARAARRWHAGTWIVTAALAAFAALAPAVASELLPWPGGATPALGLKDLDGRMVRLADFRGRPVLVHFWATWCAPCVEELPSLQRLADRLAPQGLEIIAVNEQETAARIRPFAERLGLALRIVRDHDGSARDAWGVRVFPSTFVVGPDGRIALAGIGAVDWDDGGVESRLRALLTGGSVGRVMATLARRTGPPGGSGD